MSVGKVYLIPTFLHPENIETIPKYVLDCIKDCSVFFVENEKTTRRFFKRLWKEMVIDDYQWIVIDKIEQTITHKFIQLLQTNHNIGIVSEAGCPGVADPGQQLVAAAQQFNATIYPLVGPNAILLALMASGMNGQCFKFNGYLPIDLLERKKTIKAIENHSHKNDCTEIFIETPYRNNALVKDLLETCNTQTLLCIATNITAPQQCIKTKTIQYWGKNVPDIHKHLAIFLIKSQMTTATNSK